MQRVTPDCVFVFVFVFVYIKFELRKDLTLPAIYPTLGFPTRPLPYLWIYPTEREFNGVGQNKYHYKTGTYSLTPP